MARNGHYNVDQHFGQSVGMGKGMLTNGSASANQEFGNDAITPTLADGGPNPTNISGLYAWYDFWTMDSINDFLMAGTAPLDYVVVSPFDNENTSHSIRDLSGNNRNLSIPSVTPSTLKRVNRDGGILPGPSLTNFNQNSRLIGPTGAPNIQTQPFTQVYYTRTNNSTSGHVYRLGSDDAFVTFSMGTGGIQMQMNAGTALTAVSTIPVKAWRFVIAEFNGASSKFYVNSSTAEVTGNAGTNSMDEIRFPVGSPSDSDNWLAEAIFYNKILTDADRANLIWYWNRKYDTAFV